MQVTVPTRSVPTLMGARGAVPQANSTSSLNANPPVSPRNNFSWRPMPTVPSINTGNNIPAVPPQPTITKPLPTLNRPLPGGSAAPSNSAYEASPNMTTQTSQYNMTKPLPLSPRQQVITTPEVAPVTPRSQWNDTTRAAVERKPLPVVQPSSQPTAASSYSTSPVNAVSTQYSSSNFSSNNFSSANNTTSASLTSTTSSPTSFNNSSYSTSSNSASATVVQNLTELPPTPSKVPKMEKLKNGDVIRLHSMFNIH